MSNTNVLQSPTSMGIIGFSAFTISPLSSGTKFWNHANTPIVDSLRTPAGNRTNFSLSGIQTPQMFSQFWTDANQAHNVTPAIEPVKDAYSKSVAVESGNDSDFIELDTAKSQTNTVYDADDCTAPPTPQSNNNNNEQPQQIKEITQKTMRVQNLGGYSLVQQTQVSIVPNNMIQQNLPQLPNPPVYSSIVKHESGEPAPKRRLVQLATPSTIHNNFKLDAPPNVKIESVTNTYSQPTSQAPSPSQTVRKQKAQKEKKYACDWENCTKAFYRADELKRHMRVHTKEKPFPCPHCDRHFARSDHVRTHVRIHTGEKPYQCKFCPKCFARSDERLRHHKVHEKRTKKEQEAKMNQMKMETMGYSQNQQQQLAIREYASRSNTPTVYPGYANSPASQNGYPGYQQQQQQQTGHYIQARPQAIPRPAYQRAHPASQQAMIINGSPVVSTTVTEPQRTQTAYYTNGNSSSRNASYESQTQYHYYQ